MGGKLNREWTMRIHNRQFLAFLVVVVVLAGQPAGAADDIGVEWIEGSLLVARGMPAQAMTEAAPVITSLRLDNGEFRHLDLATDQLAALGDPVGMSGRRIRVRVPVDSTGARAGSVRPMAVERVVSKSSAPEVASGSYAYASLMCRFPDVGLPSEGLGYFQGMYANSWPGLDHYWRRQSYNMVNVLGSTAAGWFTMPHNQPYYEGLISGGSYSTMLSELYADCTNAASGSINVGAYDGVNLMFNDTFGPYAWGGWGGVTWEPPWGWRNVAVIAHEMGHAFGLPHSNNADNDGSPYDNPWDVMSDSWGSALHDGTYGTIGKHTISYHKDSLGWISPARKAVISAAGLFSYKVDHLTAAGTGNLHMIKVPITGSTRFYTVEVRDRTGYDGNLPGFAVIIHEVNYSRQEPAWLVDASDPANGGDAGAMWMPGECFDDAANEISICVETITTEGYRIEIAYGDWGYVFDDDFESATTSGWGTAIN